MLETGIRDGRGVTMIQWARNEPVIFRKDEIANGFVFHSLLFFSSPPWQPGFTLSLQWPQHGPEHTNILLDPCHFAAILQMVSWSPRRTSTPPSTMRSMSPTCRSSRLSSPWTPSSTSRPSSRGSTTTTP
jgi:hypothetical protein